MLCRRPHRLRKWGSLGTGCQRVLCLQAITIGNVFQESAMAAKVHPAVLRLGLQYADGSITGSNARCLAMLLTFKAVIQVSPCF